MIKKIPGKEHIIIKRGGKEQKFNIQKLKRAVLWRTDGSEPLADELIESLNIKIYNKMKIEKLWEEVIKTASNKISEMFPIWDNVAKRAYILKIYKETYNLKINTKKKHNYLDIIDKGIKSGVYNKEVFEYFSEEELEELGNYINIERDFNFTFIGVNTIMDKYAFNYSPTKKLELPQHVYMRLAIFAFYKTENKEERMKLIKQRYDHLSLFYFTEATPKMVNSLTYNPQMRSCVLSITDDNIESINRSDNNLGVFSKYGGGLAIDVSHLRCSGSYVGKQGGKSSGPVQFIKKFERTVNAYDQMGKRKGACVVTFPFWHYDVKDLIMLKDAGGSEDNRRRKMQYTVKWYNILTKRIKNNKNITLFDPKDVQDLNYLWGEEFEKKYLEYETKNIRKKIIPARDLAFLISKVRSETGNLYIVFPDNINSQRMGEEPVYASNLCTEVFIPTKAAKEFSSEIKTTFGENNFKTYEKYETGEIGLCNLSSVNIMKWITLSKEEKDELMYNLLVASDNLINYRFYPIKDAELSNQTRRPIGIGVSNFANYLASNGTKWSDKKSLELTHKIFEEISFYILKNSNKLAKERGKYHHFDKSNWAKGLLPMDLYKMKDNKELNFDLEYEKEWEILREEIIKFGLRFSYHMAIAPTRTSSLAIDATEGVEPIKKIFQIKEGTYSFPIIAPNLRKNRQYYENAFDVSNKVINKLASIRQKFLDQGQSVNHYYKITDSSYEIIKDIINSEELGMKSIYYLQPLKRGDIDAGCESCSS